MTALAAVKPTESTDIALIVESNPSLVLIDPGKRDDLFAHIRSEIEAFEPDISTAKGRDKIKSFAFKITRTKTAIDDAGKRLNEEARTRINAVDAERRKAREELAAMAEEVRRPLTEWEDAEKERAEECEAEINRIILAGTVTLDDTAATVRARGAEIWAIEITEARYQSLFDQATAAKAATVDRLKAALARMIKEEADRAELDRLRAEAAEREAKEAVEREAREAEAQAKAEAEAAEQRRIAAEKAELERAERIRQEAETRAKQKAEQAAAVEAKRVQREHDEALAAERKRAEDAERTAKAERDRIAAEDVARKAEAKRIADEQTKREADQAHRTRVKSAAKAAIMSCGADEETARKIVTLIIAKEVPHVRMEF